jgi:hypothetical protein
MKALCASVSVLLAALAAVPAARAIVVPVTTTAELVAAIDAAQPGDVITLAPGTYTVTQNLNCDAPGTPDDPIVVRAEVLGQALIRFDALEGFKVSARHWIFENLDIRGVCSVHSDCEHAFHLFGDADFTRIRFNRVRDFNAQIKSNITGGQFPDDVIVEDNELADTAPRQTSNPVTKIDVVGGRRWRVRANFLHDFEKGQGDTVSYAGFLKGNSRDGLFERNLVICERDHAGGVRLGLSLGGGGSSPGSICEDGTCTPEHQNGILRDNVIVNCPADVGIYINEGFNSRIHHNTLVGNTGIDIRFAASTADLRNNIVSGQIRNRDGGTSTQADNLTGVTVAQAESWFVAPLAGDLTLLDGSAFVDEGQPLALVPADYCRNGRNDGAADLGAVEYDGDGPCVTQLAGGGVDIFDDGFETGGVGQWSTRQR